MLLLVGRTLYEAVRLVALNGVCDTDRSRSTNKLAVSFGNGVEWSGAKR
jgi:hypothetical protein